MTFVSFGTVMSNTYFQKSSFYTIENLVFIVFTYLLFVVGVYHFLSYSIDRDTFVFSKADAMFYFNESMRMSKMDISESFRYLSKLGNFDDWGVFLWISTMFRIIPSKLFLNFSYCIMGTISAVMLFNIGRNLMQRRYAYMAALSFSIASFTALFHAQCLKETIVVFLVIISFNSFYIFLRNKNFWFLAFSLLWSLSLLLFRIPISLLLIISFGLTLIFIFHKRILVPSVILALIIYSISFFRDYTYDRYLRGGDINVIMERKMELSNGGGILNETADPLAAVIGPFPSIFIKAIVPTPLYASGLLYRLLLALPFLLGAIYAFRHKYQKIYPLVFFFLMNAIGVIISTKGLELRLSLPHLAMMYLVAFWLLAKYDYRMIRRRISNKFIYGYFACVVVISLIWNFRGI
jgi:hypothetical protein